MTNNYGKLISDALGQVFQAPRDALAANLPAELSEGRLAFGAFGGTCEVEPGRITLDGREQDTVTGLLIAHYCLSAGPDQCVIEPLYALKEFPGGARFWGASTTHAERLLVPHVDNIKRAVPKILAAYGGVDTTAHAGGDFSFLIRPLPKIALCYVFYEADEDFRASVTCLYSNNAHKFLPIDGLGDLGEYTSKAMLELIGIA